jgi:competence protein ComGC
MKKHLPYKFIISVLILFFILSCGKIKETVQDKIEEKVNEKLEEEFYKIDSIRMKLDSLDFDSIQKQLDSIAIKLKPDS